MSCLHLNPLSDLVRGVTFQTLVACLACFVFSQLLTAHTSVVLSVSKESKLVVYSLNDDGSLKVASETDTHGNPGCAITSHGGNYLYVAMNSTGSIASYSFDHKTGLKLLGQTQVGATASYLTIDPTGDYLFSSYYSAGKIAVHRINEDGTLQTAPLQMIKTDERAHCIALDRSGANVFVPHVRPEAIFQFKFDPKQGTLTPNAIPKLMRKVGTGPRHLWFHPNMDLAYGSDEQGNSVTVYQLDPETGTLSVAQSLSTLPDKFKGKNSTSDIEVHPSNKCVFVANRGSDTIASFVIESKTGLLSPLEHFDVTAFTRSFNISADGKYLVAAGQRSDKLKVFAIENDGKTELLSTVETGRGPRWVQVIQDNEKR